MKQKLLIHYPSFFKNLGLKSRIVALLLLVFFTGLFPYESINAQTGTVVFSNPNTINIGTVLHDGTYSNDIEGIQLNIFGAMTLSQAVNRTPYGSFAFLTISDVGLDYPVFVPIDATSGTSSIDDITLPRILVIMSHDGSQFNFKSIYVGDYIDSNNPIKFEGFRDGLSTGSVVLAIGVMNNYQKTFDSTNGLTASIFQNVDEVRITNQNGGDMVYGLYAGFNRIDIGPAVVPSTLTVSTVAASGLTATSATLGGNITNDGGASISERGVVYSTTDNTPTIAEGASKVAIGSGTGVFSHTITGLSSSTTYYYAAYAINSAGTSYGSVETFTTTLSSSCMKLTVDDMPLDGDGYGNGVSAFYKLYSGVNVKLTPAENSSNYVGMVDSSEPGLNFNGLYPYSGTESETEISISIPGYSFDLNSFSYLIGNAISYLDITLTFVDGATDTKRYPMLSSVETVGNFTTFTTPANDVTNVKFVSDNYMLYNDFCIDDIKAFTPTSLQEQTVFTVHSYPNPTSAMLYINNGSEDSEISVYSLQGKRLLQTTGNKIDMSALVKGIYVLDVNGAKAKVVKE